ncbi:hypothetical protein DFP77_105134 [Marinomonas foliarum]|jgi:hypothetical protein|uniref:Uncharacterized protein n=1 Tax=Marinomonas foliarum TaxID=491950 RepID=A0A369ADT3_9GAMM|nr:hypothetical protein DFP77_105134 [Marinomonas foliarum]
MPRILTDIYAKAANRSIFEQIFPSKMQTIKIEFALLFRRSVLIDKTETARSLTLYLATYRLVDGMCILMTE